METGAGVQAEQVTAQHAARNRPTEPKGTRSGPPSGKTEASTRFKSKRAPIGSCVCTSRRILTSWPTHGQEMFRFAMGTCFLSLKNARLRDGERPSLQSKQLYSYRPGHSAKWYAAKLAGVTRSRQEGPCCDRRPDGSVIAAKNKQLWVVGGDPMSAELASRRHDCCYEKAQRRRSQLGGDFMQSVPNGIVL